MRVATDCEQSEVILKNRNLQPDFKVRLILTLYDLTSFSGSAEATSKQFGAKFDHEIFLVKLQNLHYVMPRFDEILGKK